MAVTKRQSSRAGQGRRIGYARVSTVDQHCEVQRQELRNAGCDAIYADMMSGTRLDRPELDRALRALRPGDSLVIVRLDRLGRSILHVPALLQEIEEKGAALVSLKESFDSSTAAGRLMRNIMISFGDYERELIVERTKAGLATARARGWVPGNPAVMRGDKAVIARIKASRNETLNQKALAASEPWVHLVRRYRPTLPWRTVLGIINREIYKDKRQLRLETLQRRARRLVEAGELESSVLKRTGGARESFAAPLARRLKEENPDWSLRRLGEELDRLCVAPPRGGDWHAMGVKRLLEEAERLRHDQEHDR